MVNWYNHFENKTAKSSQDEDVHILYEPAISLLGIYSRETLIYVHRGQVQEEHILAAKEPKGPLRG